MTLTRQNVLGIGTLMTGLLLCPGALLMGRLGQKIGGWYDRIGPTRLVIPGVVIVTSGSQFGDPAAVTTTYASRSGERSRPSAHSGSSPIATWPAWRATSP